MSPEEMTLVMNNLRVLCPDLFMPHSQDLVKAFEVDREKALAAVPEYIARVKLGLFDADEERGWPALDDLRPS